MNEFKEALEGFAGDLTDSMYQTMYARYKAGKLSEMSGMPPSMVLAAAQGAQRRLQRSLTYQEFKELAKEVGRVTGGKTVADPAFMDAVKKVADDKVAKFSKADAGARSMESALDKLGAMANVPAGELAQEAVGVAAEEAPRTLHQPIGFAPETKVEDFSFSAPAPAPQRSMHQPIGFAPETKLEKLLETRVGGAPGQAQAATGTGRAPAAPLPLLPEWRPEDERVPLWRRMSEPIPMAAPVAGVVAVTAQQAADTEDSKRFSSMDETLKKIAELLKPEKKMPELPKASTFKQAFNWGFGWGDEGDKRGGWTIGRRGVLDQVQGVGQMLGRGYGKGRQIGKAFGLEKLGGVAGLAVTGLTAFAGAVRAGVDKLLQWNERLSAADMRLAEFSGAMALVKAEKEVRDFGYSRRRGDARAESARFREEAYAEMRSSFAKLTDLFANVQNYLAGHLMKIIAHLGRLVGLAEDTESSAAGGSAWASSMLSAADSAAGELSFVEGRAGFSMPAL